MKPHFHRKVSRVHNSLTSLIVLITCVTVSASLSGQAIVKPDEPRAETPPQSIAAPTEFPGALVICGGGPMPQRVYDRFIELAGGKMASIVVIPTASSHADDDDAPKRYLEPWHRRGCVNIALIHTRLRQEANQESFCSPLKTADAVWISGGGQSKIADAYVGTQLQKELFDLLKRGGVIGGTSAGAAIMSKTMIASGNPQAVLKEGLGLLSDVVIDQHFSRRNRLPRLTKVLESHPQFAGIGIDENTAIIVQSGEFEVVGEHQVTVINAGIEAVEKRKSLVREGETITLSELR